MSTVLGGCLALIVLACTACGPSSPPAGSSTLEATRTTVTPTPTPTQTPTPTATAAPTTVAAASVNDQVDGHVVVDPPQPKPQPKPAPSYKNCDAVRAAGAAPIHPGDPGWQQKFDADHDGVGCE